MQLKVMQYLSKNRHNHQIYENHQNHHVHHDHQDKEPDAPLFRRKSPHLFRWTSSSRASSPSSMETCNLPTKSRLDLGTFEYPEYHIVAIADALSWRKLTDNSAILLA